MLCELSDQLQKKAKHVLKYSLVPPVYWWLLYSKAAWCIVHYKTLAEWPWLHFSRSGSRWHISQTVIMWKNGRGRHPSIHQHWIQEVPLPTGSDHPYGYVAASRKTQTPICYWHKLSGLLEGTTAQCPAKAKCKLNQMHDKWIHGRRHG